MKGWPQHAASNAAACDAQQTREEMLIVLCWNSMHSQWNVFFSISRLSSRKKSISHVTTRRISNTVFYYCPRVEQLLHTVLCVIFERLLSNCAKVSKKKREEWLNKQIFNVMIKLGIFSRLTKYENSRSFKKRGLLIMLLVEGLTLAPSSFLWNEKRDALTSSSRVERTSRRRR